MIKGYLWLFRNLNDRFEIIESIKDVNVIFSQVNRSERASNIVCSSRERKREKW